MADVVSGRPDVEGGGRDRRLATQGRGPRAADPVAGPRRAPVSGPGAPGPGPVLDRRRGPAGRPRRRGPRPYGSARRTPAPLRPGCSLAVRAEARPSRWPWATSRRYGSPTPRRSASGGSTARMHRWPGRRPPVILGPARLRTPSPRTPRGRSRAGWRGPTARDPVVVEHRDRRGHTRVLRWAPVEETRPERGPGCASSTARASPSTRGRGLPVDVSPRHDGSPTEGWRGDRSRRSTWNGPRAERGPLARTAASRISRRRVR